MDFLPSFFDRLSNEGINGLQAIQYIFSFLMILFKDANFCKVNANSVDKLTVFIDKLSRLYNDLRLEINFDLDSITNKFFDFIDKIDISKINKLNLLDHIYKYYLENENLTMIKDYVKYYNNKLLSDWIFNLSKDNTKELNSNQTIFVGNVKINSCFDNFAESNNIKSKSKNDNKLYGHQNNKTIKNFIILNTLMNHNKNYLENFGSNDLLIEDINLPTKSFDLIFFDFPSGIHNIVHASCCNKIKKLKLRGTKSEPLLLQLIMCSLNKNGKAILVVPDSLLYGDSIQSIETRKYLMENYNVTKIIQIDESFYFNKGIKNSILCFENNGNTKSVYFSKISHLEQKVIETKLIDVLFNETKSKLYSLYYKNYEIIRKSNNKIDIAKFDELFEIKTRETDLPDNNFICLEKHYRNEQSIQISSTKSSNYEYYIIQKTLDNTNFNIKLLENVLKTKYLNLVKGKMNQFDINKINELDFPIVPESIKKSVNEYIDITNQIILDNNDKIVKTNKLKKCLIDSINSDNMIEINKIVQLCDKKSEINGRTIGVIRNGLTAGNVYLLEDPKLASNNSHYLKINDINYMLDYVYHYLKNNESKLIELANLNPQPNLSQTNLLNFKIQNIPMENQIELANYCNDFDQIINKYKYDNKLLMEKDIMSIVLKINMFV